MAFGESADPAIGLDPPKSWRGVSNSPFNRHQVRCVERSLTVPPPTSIQVPMKELRFALLGTGFWAQFQLAAWQELPGVRCVALWNRTKSRAEALASRFGVPAVYDDVRELLEREELDFVDIVAGEEVHAELTRLAAARRRAVICQKPMARSYDEALAMVETCRQAGVPFFVHENFRFQSGLRALGEALHRGG